jgi:site-specific recombinase
MKEVLLQFIEKDSDKLSLLVKLIDDIRPKTFDDFTYSVKKIKELREIIDTDEQLKKEFASQLIIFIGNSKQSELFTQVNLLSRGTLLSEIRKRLFQKILPAENDTSTLRGIINTIFYKKKDYDWLEKIPDEVIVDLLISLKIIHPSELDSKHFIVDELLNDIYILSQVITSLSIDKNIVKNFDSVLAIDSPFMRLHEQVDIYVALVEKSEISKKSTEQNYINLVNRINECYNQINIIRESKSVYGTSLELTVVLNKIKLSLIRLNNLLDLLVSHEKSERHLTHLVSFIKELVRNENKKNSIRNYFNETISLLAFQITEHTGKIGEHYVTSTAKEYFHMFYNAIKGGLIVGFLVILKFLINGLYLPLFQDTLLKALNYSFGFIGIQLIHGTLATKQPSMTAATIAHAIENKSDDGEVKEIAEFIIKVIRSQFIAVVGNVIIALPVAYAISWVWLMVAGHPIANSEKALHKMHELNPFTTLCVVHAAIAGIMLFISGTLAGISENANVYNGYSRRIKKHPFLLKVLGVRQTEKLGNYVADNIGGLTGNFTLGFFLAFVAFFGSIFGLPLDIQHVTFASGNLGMAMASLGMNIDLYDVSMACVGILLIGTTNILVSFSLALIVATKSRGIKLTRTPQVLFYLLKSFIKNPVRFVFPKKEKE